VSATRYDEKSMKTKTPSGQTDDRDIAPLTALSKVLALIRTLRGKDGCPWDRKQTPTSMSVYLIEEVYELVEAITTGDPEAVEEELGDVLFHILFLSTLYQESNHFDLGSAAEAVLAKMIRRHPHVFDNARTIDVDTVRKQWREIKQQEKTLPPQSSVLDSVPAGLPALMRAYRISERAAGIGFDWDDVAGVMQKVEEELNEFTSAVKQNNPQEMALEFGDILFTLVNVARLARIHPETALAESTRKFEQRFRYMEKQTLEEGKPIDTVSREQLEALWQDAKNNT
jgi:tetrapyrrole methylase family protein/MazG family protein